MKPGDDKRSSANQPWRALRGEVSSSRRSLLRLAAVLVIALVAGLVIWLVVGKSNNSSKSSATKVAISEQGLQKLAAAINMPVFWAGPEQGARYGVEQRSNGQVYVRYLTAEMKTDTVATLTVGTYPMENAYSKTIALSKQAGSTPLTTGTGGVAAFTTSAHPLSVFFALRGLDEQIEVYDPTSSRAAALVQAGRVLQVTQGERLGLTLAELKKKVSSLGTPVYWIGPKPGVTYEYTRNPNGNVYLRYLPKGVAVGISALYPTVGTYPMSKAVATTRAAGGQTGAVRVNLAGAEAFYNTSKPTSVFAAFTGSDYQIEVYDPVSTRALAAVKSGQLKPVG